MARQSCAQRLLEQECNKLSPYKLRAGLLRQRILTCDFERRKRVDTPTRAAIVWLDLDRVEQRFLLSGCLNGGVAAYDILLPSYSAPEELRGKTLPVQVHSPVFQVGGRQTEGHRARVTSVLWYPVDSGLFITSSLDKTLRVWDSNAVVQVTAFTMETAVHCAAMSPLASAHALIAAGCEDAAVMLCDTRTGASTHRMVGHNQPVWAAAWSVSSPWLLTTGACDGQVRVWDIRRTGCTAALDQHDTEPSPATVAMPSPSERPSDEVPGATADTSSAIAHDGRITAVLPAPDGLSWITAGTDDRVRVWSMPRFRNTLLNFTGTYNRAGRARQMAITEDSKTVFHPSGSAVQMLDLQEGTLLNTLQGAHFETLHCCAWNDRQQELYTGGNDMRIHVWAPQQAPQPEETGEQPVSNGDVDDDDWSGDDY